MKNIPWKGRGQGQVTVLEFYTLWNISETLLQATLAAEPCKTAEPTGLSLGGDSCGSKEPLIKFGEDVQW